VPAKGAWLGAWHKNLPSDTWSTTEFANFEAKVGRKMNIDHRYHSWGSTYWPYSADSWDVANDRIPMESLGGSFPGLDAINNGSQDAWLRGVADRVRAFGSKVFFRPLWEMNGDWSLWDGTHNNAPGQTDGPAKYVAAWRRMRDIFAREGAANAVWVWAPNCTDQPQAAWNHWSRYYPGNAYVDWVACDGYNRGSTAEWSEWEPFARIFGGQPSVYGDYRRKPFMVAETASCEEGGSKVAWLQGARRQIKTVFPNIKALVWFDALQECDWRVTSSRASLRAFRALAADSYFKP
jgi:beta-mannanase